MLPNKIPNIPIEITLPSLSQDLKERYHIQLSEKIQGILDSLGIPGKINLRIWEDSGLFSEKFRLYINGHFRHYATDQLFRAYCLATQKLFQPFYEIDQWFEFSHTESSIPPVIPDQQLFLNYLIEEILLAKPSILFQFEQFEHYWHSLGLILAPESPISLYQLHKVLKEILDFNINLTKKEEMRACLQEWLQSSNADLNTLKEGIINKFHAKNIILKISKDYFLELIQDLDSEQIHYPFQSIRDLFQIKWGITVPPIQLEFTQPFQERQIQIQINDFAYLPFLGLAPDQFLSNHNPRSHGIKVIIPLNNNLGTVISTEADSQIEDHFVTQWKAFDYLGLCLGKEISEHKELFINESFTTKYQEALQEVEPHLTSLFKEVYPTHEVLTQTLRQLLKQNIPIRDGKLILTSMLESNFVLAHSQEEVLFDSRIPVFTHDPRWHNKPRNLTKYIRSKLKHPLLEKLKNEPKINAYKLDRDTISQLTNWEINSSEPPNEFVERLFFSIRKELSEVSFPFVIYVPSSIRDLLESCTHDFFPEIRIVTLEEINTISSQRLVHKILRIPHPIK